MLNKKQRILAAAALCALVVLAAGLNWGAMRMNSHVEEPPAQAVSGQVSKQTQAAGTSGGKLTFVADYKQQRGQTRQEQTQHLETILQDENTDDATRRAAQEQLMEIVAHSQTELAIETLLEAKGFTGVAVAVNSDMINIIVEAQTLEDAQVAQILQIAMREGGVKAENVKIISENLVKIENNLSIPVPDVVGIDTICAF